MSRNVDPRMRRLKDSGQRRAKFVCTGRGKHEVYVLRQYVETNGAVMRHVGMKPTDDSGPLDDRLPTCPKCNRPGMVVADDEEGVRRLLDQSHAGYVPRWDVSTQTLLT